MKKLLFLLLTFSIFQVGDIFAGNFVDWNILDEEAYHGFVYLEGQAGLTIFSKPDEMPNPTDGETFYFALRFPVYKQKVSLAPYVSMSNFKDDWGGTISYKLAINKYGVRTYLNAYESESQKWAIDAFADLAFTTSINDSITEVDPGSGVWVSVDGGEYTTDSKSVTTHLFKNKSTTFGLGFRLRYTMFFVEYAYDIYKPNVTYLTSASNSRNNNPNLTRSCYSIGITIPFFPED